MSRHRRKAGKEKPSAETTEAEGGETEELSTTLLAPPTRLPPPPIEPRAATLPLQQLAWEDFERLLVALVREVLHWQEVRRYGVKGQAQHGIDLYGYMANGKVGTCQAKDVKDFKKGDLRAAIRKFTKGKRPFKSRWLAVVVACPVERTEILDELHKLKTANRSFSLRVCDQHDVSELLRKQHMLVRRFFGSEWERVFCDPLPDSSRPPYVQDERQRRLEESLVESRARLVSRWISAGVAEAQAEAFAADANLGLPQGLSASLSEKGLVLLEGDFGSGKSTAGERLHQRAVERALTEPTVPVPVYLSAREVRGPLRDAVLGAAVGLGAPAQLGAHIVLDGIDELGLHAARDFIEQARVLVRLWPHTRCLLTARPSDMLNRFVEHVPMPLLTDKEVRALAGRIAGVRGWTDWPSSVWATARRPLFALVAASLRNTPGRPIPRTAAGFLDELVQRALERTGQLENDAQAGLRRLAALTLTSGGTIPQGEFGVEPDIQRLLATRLVVRRGRTLVFTLPVIEQYFGAQALLTGTVKAETAWGSLESFDRWRDAVVLAVGSGSWEQVSALLTDLAGRYPGAAAWVVKKALSEHGLFEFEEDTENAPALPPGTECARRLQSALTSWVQAIRPFSERTQLVGPKGESLTLAARREGKTQLVTSAWRTEAPEAMRGGELPPDWEFADALWRRSERVASAESAWPWMMSLRWLRQEVERVLSAKNLPLRETSPDRAERRWALARALTGSRRDLLHAPIPADVALTHVRQLLESLDDADDVEFVQLGRPGGEHPTFLGKEIREFAADLTAGKGVGPDGLLRRPWTVPDLPESRSGFIWGLYSQEAHLRLIREVYPAALDIYEELVATWLPKIRPTMDWACASPIRLKGFLEFNARGGPWLNYHVRPLPRGVKSDVVINAAPADFDVPAFERACVEDTAGSLDVLRERSPAAASWFRLVVTQTSVRLYGNTPAIDLAYEWLADQLQALSLVSFGYYPPREY